MGAFTKTYEVKIRIAGFAQDVRVDADSPQVALEMVKRQYGNPQILLPPRVVR